MGCVADDGSANLLPLFPLGHVLMPGCPLPLRIFEPRYRRLLSDVTAEGAPRRFGVVALTAGSEVQASPNEPAARFSRVGTVAEILEVQTVSDGTFGVLTGGSSRFRVVRAVETGAPYLVAEVAYLDEVDGDLPDGLIDATRALSTEYTRLFGLLTATEQTAREPYPSDPSLLSYRLAVESPLTQVDQQLLLEDATAAARLLHLQRLLRRELVLLRRTRTVAVSPALLRVMLRPG